MDTRSKILTADRAAEIKQPVVLVTGTFDLLRAAHARELAAVRSRIGPAGSLAAAILPGGREWLTAQARAELVAGIRVVDYVVIAAGCEADDWIALLRPTEVVRIEADDPRHTQELIRHVQQQQHIR
jgi:glycerol-3-phosphate cytidylyltransferase-like family protein